MFFSFSISVPLLCSQRMLLSVLSCLCFFVSYTMRINLSVAIVCMINQTHLEIDEIQGDLYGNNSQGMNNKTNTNTCTNTLSNSTKVLMLISSMFSITLYIIA